MASKPFVRANPPNIVVLDLLGCAPTGDDWGWLNTLKQRQGAATSTQPQPEQDR
jgi:hypothetical protein